MFIYNQSVRMKSLMIYNENMFDVGKTVMMVSWLLPMTKYIKVGEKKERREKKKKKLTLDQRSLP
jgi:hypothetical protein